MLTDEQKTMLMAVALEKISWVRESVLREVSEEQRLTLFKELTRGYCTYCGGSSLPCTCMRDE